MMRLTLRRKPPAGAQVAQPPAESVATRPGVSLAARLARWLARQAGAVDGLVRRRTVVISAEADAVRVLVVRRREVLAWGMADLGAEQETREDGATPDEQRVAALRGLLGRLGVRYARVVSDLPLYAPLERHISLSKIARRHLESVVLSEVLESVPFTQGEADISWQARKNGAGLEVSATAVSKATVDGLVRWLKEAGARPSAIYSRAIALARAAGVADAVVVHLADGTLSVVLVRDRLPRVVYQETYLGSEAAPQAVAELVAEAAEQVDDYHRGANGADGSGTLPVVLTGRLAAQGPLLDDLRRLLAHEIVPLAVPFRCPEQFPADEYAIALGLALADRDRVKRGGQTSKRPWRALGLLPERHVPVRIPMGRLACLVALMLLAVAGVNATARVGEVVERATALSVRVGQLQQQDRQYRVELASASAAEQGSRRMEQFAADLESSLVDLKGEVESLVGRLDGLTGLAETLGIQLASVVSSGSGYTVTGAALSYEDALAYTDALRSSGWFSHVALSRVEASQDAGAASLGLQLVGFQVKVSVGASAGDGSVAQR